ncbi:MAG: alpha/beta hydrolase-fold protein [Bacteroidota bacterium]
MRKIFIFTLILFRLSLEAQTFQQFLDRINGAPATQRQAIADSFMNSAISFPFIEDDTIVHFVYNYSVQSVAMAGDATGWSPDKMFTNISGCNFWYLTLYYEADARLDYKLVINSTDWILDPKNPHTCSGGYGPNSELRMPGYIVPPEISYYSAIPHGTIKDTAFHSNILGNNRQVRVYLPPGYPTGSDAYPVILFHDGLEYITLCNANNILDYLISEHLMVPVIAVFVPPVDRTAEYAGNKIDKFTEFIASELIPVIDANYKTSKDPSKRAMAGASDGGNISLYIGMKHPELFGKIAAQSSDVIPAISQTFSGGPKLNLSLYIDIGTYDIAQLIPMVHNFRDILQNKGYNYQFREWHEGHSWGNWKGHLRLPLMQFFPWTSGLNETPGNGGLKLEQNRPNPFRDHTMIFFSAPRGQYLELIISDLNGRKIETLYSGFGSDRPQDLTTYYKEKPGQYICTIISNGVRLSRIITAVN